MLVFAPDAGELGCCVFGDFLLNVGDVGFVEGGGLAVFEDHEVEIFVGGEGGAGKDFERGARNATWGELHTVNTKKILSTRLS